MSLERPRIDMLLSLVVLSLVTNILDAALTLLSASTPESAGVRVTAVSTLYI